MSALSHAPGREWIAEHRAVWARKPVLRAVYRRYFAAMRTACGAEPIVEIGCGPGFLKEAFPEITATDVTPGPFAERVIDATALPFADGSLGALVMLDVFHHLPRPGAFLAEAARTLTPGGRLVLLEPWIGLAGRLLYRWVHHEVCDPRVDPAAPWVGADKDPMLGNAALPFLWFRAGGAVERSGLPLGVVRRDAFAALPWVLSGGFQPLSLLPLRLLGWAEGLDRGLSRWPALTATRCLIVVERDAAAGARRTTSRE